MLDHAHTFIMKREILFQLNDGTIKRFIEFDRITQLTSRHNNDKELIFRLLISIKLILFLINVICVCGCGGGKYLYIVKAEMIFYYRL